MGLKIPVYLAFLCAVNASVIIKVFETDEALAEGYKEHAEVHLLQGCDDMKCSKMCRENGFPLGGSCYAGHCECTKMDVRTDERIYGEINDLLDCNDRECNQMCQDNHFGHGWCVAGSCVCNVLVPKVDKLYDIEGGCNPLACDQLCRQIGRQGGVCVNDRCKCDIFESLTVLDSNDIEDSCNPRTCKSHCREQGFSGGVCVNDECRCNSSLPLTENSISFEAVDGCNKITCQQTCRSLEYKDGNCSGPNKCVCDEFTETKADKESPRACSKTTCNQMCQRSGYSGGDCVGDKCKCRIMITKEIKLSAHDESEEKKELNDDIDDGGSKS